MCNSFGTNPGPNKVVKYAFPQKPMIEASLIVFFSTFKSFQEIFNSFYEKISKKLSNCINILPWHIKPPRKFYANSTLGVKQIGIHENIVTPFLLKQKIGPNDRFLHIHQLSKDFTPSEPIRVWSRSLLSLLLALFLGLIHFMSLRRRRSSSVQRVPSRILLRFFLYRVSLLW